MFFCTHDGAHKFWRVCVCDGVQTVCWGRIGTLGQTLTRTFDTIAAAQEATNGLIAQKIAKGYAEVSADEARAALPVPIVRPGKIAVAQLLLTFDDAEAHSAPNAALARPVAATPPAADNLLSLF